MKAFVHETLIRASLFLGSWPIRFFAWWIATGYFFFLPSRRRSSIRLYQVIFPEKSRWYYLCCTWRQFHSYAATFAERIEFDRNKGLTTSTQGRENLVEVARRGGGGVILMSHLGSFEIAAGAFREVKLKLLLIMGEKEAKQVARDQREAMKARGIHIQVATTGEDFLFGGVEAVKFIKEGGFVSVAGDLVWTEQRSRLPVTLFGHEVGLTAGPHLLALVSNAPLFTMFTFRSERGKYLIIMSPPRDVKATSRSERSAALHASAQAYANALEEMVRQHPFQWYIFEPFFEPISADMRKLNPSFSASNPGKDLGRQNFLLDGMGGK
ncbi:MAG TPA: lysophospholipid acyltransferase family protein [Thermodesulfobacteriota bacterium]|nr:lysophospholipid acyltransferase family protein [Thermodesulfobacteriota bacterium]